MPNHPSFFEIDKRRGSIVKLIRGRTFFQALLPLQKLGLPGQIVSPGVVQVIIQEDGRKQAEFQRRARSEAFDDLPGALIFFVGVGSDEIEVQLVGVRFGEEVTPAGEVFQIKELVFFQAMNGFDIARVGMRRRRNAHVLAGAQRLGKVAFELATVVGLPEQIAERYAVTVEMALNARGEERAGGRRTPLRKRPKEQTAAHVAGGVLHDRQAQPLGLRPVTRDVV